MAVTSEELSKALEKLWKSKPKGCPEPAVPWQMKLAEEKMQTLAASLLKAREVPFWAPPDGIFHIASDYLNAWALGEPGRTVIDPGANCAAWLVPYSPSAVSVCIAGVKDGKQATPGMTLCIFETEPPQQGLWIPPHKKALLQRILISAEEHYHLTDQPHYEEMLLPNGWRPRLYSEQHRLRLSATTPDEKHYHIAKFWPSLDPCRFIIKSWEGFRVLHSNGSVKVWAGVPKRAGG